MKKIKLLFLYSKASLSKKKFLIFMTIATLALGIASLFSVSFLSHYYEKNIQTSVVKTNGGDIKIQPKDLNKVIINEREFELLNELKEKKLLTYKLYYSEFSNIYSESDYCQSIVTYQPIDEISKKYGISTDKSEVVLSNIVAEQLKVSIGDYVKIRTAHKEHPLQKYRVKAIEKDFEGISTAVSEMELSEEILGKALVFQSEFWTKNNEYNLVIIDLLDNSKIQVVMEKLKDVFSKDFDIRTVEELNQTIKPRIDFNLKGLNMVGIFSLIISGISLCKIISYYVVIRKEEFIILRVYGGKKRDLKCLIFFEILKIALVSLIIAIPLGYIILKIINLNSMGLQIYDLLNTKSLFLLLKVIFITLSGTLIFSFVPLAMLNNIKLNAIFRGEELLARDKLKLSLPIFFMVACFGILSSIYIKSAWGIVVILFIFIIGYILFLLMKLLLLWISQLGKLFNNAFRLAFINLKEYKNSIAIANVTLIISIFLLSSIIAVLSNLLFSYREVDSKFEGNQLVINAKADKIKEIENYLSHNKKVKDYKLFSSLHCSLKKINSANIENMIDERFWSSEDMKNLYKDFSREVHLLEYHYPENKAAQNTNGKSLKIGRWFSKKDENSNKLVVSSDFLNSLVKLRIGDKLTFDINGKSYIYEIVGIKSNNELGSYFGYIVSESEVKKMVDSSLHKENHILVHTDEAFSKQDINQLLLIDESMDLVKIDFMNMLLNKFMKTQKSIFINLMILCIFTSVFMLVCNQYNLILERKQDMLIFNILGATERIEKLIFYLENFITGLLVGLIAMMFSNLSSYFIVENIFQKEYKFNIITCLIVTLSPICINLVCTFFVIRKNILSDNISFL